MLRIWVSQGSRLDNLTLKQDFIPTARPHPTNDNRPPTDHQPTTNRPPTDHQPTTDCASTNHIDETDNTVPFAKLSASLADTAVAEAVVSGNWAVSFIEADGNGGLGFEFHAALPNPRYATQSTKTYTGPTKPTKPS